MLISKAIEGYLVDAQARRLADGTVRDYKSSFRKFVRFMGDVEISAVEVADARRFMASLKDIKGKTARNIFIGLSSLWTWAKSEHIVKEHIWREIKPPKADSLAVVPFTKEDVRALLRASTRIEAKSKNGVEYISKLHNARRNRAIVIFLLDTGVRATELCTIKIGDVDMKNTRVRVMGKGRKERMITFSPTTAKIVWRYLSERKDAIQDDYLFVTEDGSPMGRDDLAHIIHRIGERAKVPDCHPHRFRHTFAVFSLVNGCDPYTLQNALGHSSMEMVKRYLNVSQVDLARIQRRSSPVANMGFGS